MFDQSIHDQRLGVLGLGEMGLPMAKQLIEAGFEVVGCDMNDEALEEFANSGGVVAERPDLLTEQVDVVHIVVRDDEQVNDVLRGSNGVFAGVGDGAVVVIHSTVRPDTCIEAATDAPCGIHLLDAPVSGMRVDAETGNLSLIVGGDEKVVEYCRPAFEAMGDAVFYMGPLGAGEVGKLSNNLISLSNIMTTAEGINLGRAFGIDNEDLLELFCESTADSWVVENWDFISEEWGETHPGGYVGAADIVGKDLQLVLELARSYECESPGAAVASQRVPAFLRRLAESNGDTTS